MGIDLRAIGSVLSEGFIANVLEGRILDYRAVKSFLSAKKYHQVLISTALICRSDTTECTSWKSSRLKVKRFLVFRKLCNVYGNNRFALNRLYFDLGSDTQIEVCGTFRSNVFLGFVRILHTYYRITFT